MELEPDDQRLLDRAIELLADSPRRIDELTRLLLDEGAFDFMGPEAADGADGAGDGDLLEEYAEYLDEVLLTSDDTWGSDTGLVGSIPQVMSGRQFTHRLTADERTNHAVVASPDLEVIDFDIGYRHTTLQLAGGGSLRVVLGELPSPQTMTGPTGWLDGFSAGDLLCFTRQGDVVTVEAVAMTGDGADEAAALWYVFEAIRQRPDDGIELPPVLLNALVDDIDRRLFATAGPPVGEVLKLAGIEERDGWYGEAGVDWKPQMQRVNDDRMRALARRYELDPCCAAAFGRVVTAWNGYFTGPGDADGWQPAASLVDDLDHGAVVEAFADYVLDGVLSGLTDNPFLHRFATGFIEAPAGRHAPTGCYLRALTAERAGRTLEMEADLEEACRRDPSFGPAAMLLAELVGDRGDARRSLGLLAQAGADGASPLMAMLRTAAEPYRGVGRNDPCPCGTGRKFKQCCQRDPKNPLDARFEWMHRKVSRFLMRPQRRGRVIDVAVATLAADDISRDSVQAVIQDPFVIDVASYEAGGLQDFLVHRGELLPADELACYAAWLAAPRMLWTVESMGADGHIDLRDEHGNDASVAAYPGLGPLADGTVLLARVAAVGSALRLIGAPVRVSGGARSALDGLLAEGLQPNTLMAWYGWTTGSSSAPFDRGAVRAIDAFDDDSDDDEWDEEWDEEGRPE